MTDYRRNHYVPIWYQDRFLPNRPNRNFHYLDMKPETLVSNGHRYSRRSKLRWGPKLCFVETDLYTTKSGSWESTDIEKHFFGELDATASNALNYFEGFTHPSASENAFNTFLPYMSIQKLRTPKGLAALSAFAKQLPEVPKNGLCPP